MRSPIRWIILLLVVPTSLGCGDRIPEGKQVLRYSFWGGYLEMSLWREMKRTFEEQNGDAVIKLEYAAGSDNPSNLVSRMLAGRAADVMMVDDDGLPWLASKGYLEPLDKLITRDAEELGIDDFFPNALESAEYQGVHWAMPWDGFCEMVYANLELFDAAGIPEPSPEWTWKEFAEIAGRLTIDRNGDGVPEQYGTFMLPITMQSMKVFWAHGAEWMDPERTRITIDTPEAAEALDLLADLYFRKRCVAIMGELGYTVEEVMLFTDRVAMVACPAYVMLNLRQLANERWDVFHMPCGPHGRAARQSYDCVGIYSKAPPEKKDLAWRWIKHILSPESQRLIGRSGRALPVRATDARESFVRPDTPQHEERLVEAMLEYGRIVPHMVATKAWRIEADAILNRYASYLTNDWGKAVMQGRNAPQAVPLGVSPDRWLSPERTVALCQVKCQEKIGHFERRGY